MTPLKAGKLMDEKVLKKLEFDKVVKRLAELAASIPGKEAVLELAPSPDIDEVELKLKQTNDALSCLIRAGAPPLGGIRDIRNALKRAELGGILNTKELLETADVLRASRQLKAYIKKDIDEEENSVKKIIDRLVTNKPLEESINNSISSEDEIADNASRQLLSIRRKIRDTQAGIKEKLDGIVRSSKMQKYMQDCLVTMREDRYVIPVKSEHKNEIKGLVHDSSASGATVYIEPAAVVEANNRIRQLRIRERQEIERILGELTSGVCEILDELLSDLGLLTELDFAFAKARLSLEYRCSCPVLNTEGIINLKKARHPLLGKDSVVPIDFWTGEDFNSLVITGPNTGGKTVTLKTVGLLTIMSQSGLHIPAAEGSKINVYSNIFADIGDEQSIEQSLSTFSSHMTNIVRILHKADSGSLVLLDELGAGTDPAEGAALAMAIIECLNSRGVTNISTTHYSELKIYAVSTQGVENASCEFDIKTLKPTYRLLIGVPGKSNAFAISERLGLERTILQRAGEFLTQEEVRFEDVIASLEQERSKIECEREEAERLRCEAEELRRELEKRNTRITEQKSRIIRQAHEQAKKILADAKDESQRIIEQLVQMKEKRFEISEAERLKTELRKKEDTVDKVLTSFAAKPLANNKPPDSVKPGDRVIIQSLGKEGTVVSTPDRNNEVAVQAGNIRVNVDLSKLSMAQNGAKEHKRVNTTGFVNDKAAFVSSRIDVRGCTVDDARILIDKFLDDASVAGLEEVTIIHGKGTGALRKGLQGFLKSNPHTVSFRKGEYGEGDSGVTIVTLK